MLGIFYSNLNFIKVKTMILKVQENSLYYLLSIKCNSANFNLQLLQQHSSYAQEFQSIRKLKWWCRCWSWWWWWRLEMRVLQV